MAHWLRSLKLAELSLVDRPANKGAKVSIFKRDDTELDALKTWSDAARLAAAQTRRRRGQKKKPEAAGHKSVHAMSREEKERLSRDMLSTPVGHAGSGTYWHPQHGLFNLNKSEEDMDDSDEDLLPIYKIWSAAARAAAIAARRRGKGKVTSADWDRTNRVQTMTSHHERGAAAFSGSHPLHRALSGHHKEAARHLRTAAGHAKAGRMKEAEEALQRARVHQSEISSLARVGKAEGAEDPFPEHWKGDDMPKTLEEQLRELQENITKATSDLAIEKAARLQAEAFAKMTDAEKEHCSGMSDDQKKAFMAKSPEDRKADMAKRAADDELITVAGVTVKKSAVGEGVFAIMKAQQVRIDKADDEIRKAREKAEFEDLKKRAKEELGHLPGTDDDKAAVLKALEAIPDAASRKAALEAMKAGNSAVRERTQELGHGRPRLITKAAEQLDDLAKDYAEKNKVTHATAYAEVLKTAKGRELYAQSENEKAA